MTKFECLASGHGLIEGPRYRAGKLVRRELRDAEFLPDGT